jgi:LPS sulfotransferase NodH
MAQSQLSPQVVTSSEAPSLAQWRGPLFVVGTWRSGTTLLYTLLNQHPQIALMYEGDLFLLRALFWIPGAESRWLTRWEFWNEPLKRHKLDTGRIPSNISRLQIAMEAAYKAYAQQKGALIWGDKIVNSYDSLFRLARVFPDARFIIIWRDPAAIYRSVIRAREGSSWFADRRGMPYRFLMGHKALKSECDLLMSRGVRVHQMQYEALVTDPASAMVGVCKFLGVPFVSPIASLEGSDRSAISEGKHHSLVKGERIVSSLERTEVLPADLKRKIERYVSFWREESGGEWPILSSPQNYNSAKPSLRERLLDRAIYRCLRTADSIVVFVYCYAPLWLLKRFRAFKRRRVTELCRN